jgi:hypothetical protein
VQGIKRLNEARLDVSGLVELIELVVFFAAAQLLRPIETLAAFPAPIRPVRKKEQDPEFQDASALGAMHVVATTLRAAFFLGVYEQA